MKKILRLFMKRHSFIVSEWETRPTRYGQDTEDSYATEYICSRCGMVSDKYSFIKTNCNY